MDKNKKDVDIVDAVVVDDGSTEGSVSEIENELKGAEQLAKDVKQIIHQSEVNIKDGKFEEAIRGYLYAIKLSPKDASLWYNLANIHFSQESYSDAQSCWQKSVDLAPGFIHATFNLALAALKAEDYETSLKYFLLVEIQDKEFNGAGALVNIGIIYDKQGHSNDAINYFKKALKINPKLDDAWNNLGCGYFDKGKFTKAEDCFSKAVGLNGKNAMAVMNLACTYANLKKPRKLKDAYSQLQLLDAEMAKELSSLISDAEMVDK